MGGRERGGDRERERGEDRERERDREREMKRMFFFLQKGKLA